MRHNRDDKRFSRTSGHLRCMLANMTNDLIINGRIKTTTPKAKLLRRYAERMITLGKKGTLQARRRAMAFMRSKSAVTKLFGDVAEMFSSRPGGYTRILKLGFRPGDAAPMSLIELVGSEEKASAEKAAPKKKTAAKKATAKKTAPKKTEAKKAAPKKAAPKKAADDEKVTKKKTEKKAAAKSTTAKSADEKKTEKKATAKSTPSKTAAKKTTAKKAAAKPGAAKSTAKKTAAKKNTAKKEKDEK